MKNCRSQLLMKVTFYNVADTTMHNEYKSESSNLFINFINLLMYLTRSFASVKQKRY